MINLKFGFNFEFIRDKSKDALVKELLKNNLTFEKKGSPAISGDPAGKLVDTQKK